MAIDTIRKRRDTKMLPHLEQYAPVWLVDEQVLEADDVLIFNVVFRHPAYGWVNRRYRYDSFNDAVYQRGQRALSEAETLELQATEPYLDAVQSDIPNSYGG
jgi:hypothetical protein